MEMEMKMEGRSNVGQEVTDSEELLHQLLRQDREKKKMKTGDADKEEEQEKKKMKTGDADKEEEQEQEQSRCRRLSKLFSQLETVKDNAIEPSKPSTEKKMMTSSSNAEAGEMDEKDCGSVDRGVEKIFKELRMLRRQNTITHWLLSSLIVITALWQLSEVSLILSVKDTVKHPFRAIGDLIMGPWRSPNKSDASNSNQHQAEGGQVKMPELPDVDFSSLGAHGNDGY